MKLLHFILTIVPTFSMMAQTTYQDGENQHLLGNINIGDLEKPPYHDWFVVNQDKYEPILHQRESYKSTHIILIHNIKKEFFSIDEEGMVLRKIILIRPFLLNPNTNIQKNIY